MTTLPSTNQQIFEDFQKALDSAKLLAENLAPEHFYLAFERCSKLQKVIFKRACGYCNTANTVPQEEKTKPKSQSTSSVGIQYYLNLPNLLYQTPPSSVLAPFSNHQSVNIKQLLLIKVSSIQLNNMDISLESYPPNEIEIIQNISYPILSTNIDLLISKLLENFPNYPNDSSQLQLYISTDNLTNFIPITNDNLILLPQLLIQSPNSLLILRNSSQITKPNNNNNLSGSSISAASSTSSSMISHNSSNLNNHDKDATAAADILVNSFIKKSEKTATTQFTKLADSEYQMASECEDETFVPSSLNKVTVKPRIRSRKYNWNVVLSQLHESPGSSICLPPREQLRQPNSSHHLLAIPPTTQKLRPTKRCQLCLRAYKHRKESRYYCNACDKGFHIRCFELYHEKLGCVDYSVSISTSCCT